MKSIALSACTFLLLGVMPLQAQKPESFDGFPKNAVEKSDLHFIRDFHPHPFATIKIYHYDGQPFTGFAFEKGKYANILEVYKNGRLHGISKSWYKSGAMKGYLKYKKGLVIVNKVWWKNGQQRWEHHYKKGYRSGKHKTWSEDGVQLSLEEYRNNGIDRTTTRWHRNGQLKEKGDYTTIVETYSSRIQKAGTWQYWDESGQLIKTERWKDGQVVE